jgi:hypothetical protein
MITNSARWSHAHGNRVVPSPWQATIRTAGSNPWSGCWVQEAQLDNLVATFKEFCHVRFEDSELGKDPVAE